MKLLRWIFEPYFSADRKGEIGEALIEKSIRRYDKNAKVLRNVYIRKPGGSTSEIDVMLISAAGIFVIESKSYKGWIFGNDDNPKWTVTLYGGRDWLGFKRTEKFHFYNPIWQNRSHISNLKRYLRKDIPHIYSVIVFSDECRFMGIEYSQENTYVCHRKNLQDILKKIVGGTDTLLTKEQVDSLYERLKPLTEITDEEKRQHIESINRKLNDKEHCPYCGGKLVERTAKKGPNAGSKFLGCENYPKCRFTKSFMAK